LRTKANAPLNNIDPEFEMRISPNIENNNTKTKKSNV
jgi:hypothetical protein